MTRTRLLLSSSLTVTVDSNSFAFTRAAGPYSYQTAVALSGTQFITTDSTANQPRFHWVPAISGTVLLIEPARTNELLQADFIDADVNNTPDGWSYNGGTPGVDFLVGSNAPHGGSYFRLAVGRPADTGYTQGGYTLTASTQYAASIWVSKSLATPDYALISDGFASNGLLSYGNTAHDWQWKTAVSTSTGTGTVIYTLYTVGTTGSCAVDLVCPQIEKGSYASTFIPTTTAAQTRPAEKLTIAASNMPRQSGVIEFDWIPGFASTDTLAENPFGCATLFSWADGTSGLAGSSIIYLYSTGFIYVRNNSFLRATSAAQTFTPWNNIFHIKVAFGSFGTRLTVNGVTTTNANAWQVPAAGAGTLGSQGDGAVIASSGFASISLSDYVQGSWNQI